MTVNKSKSVTILIVIFSLNNCLAQNSVSNKELQSIATIQLPNVGGRIDHLTYNARNQTIFVAAPGNNTVDVVDLKSQKVIHTIKNHHEPQGIKYIPENNVISSRMGRMGM